MLYLDGADGDTLDPILVACVATYNEDLDEDGQVDFKGKAKAFLRTYTFLASILPDTNAEVESVPVDGGGRKPERELDRLSNIIKSFNNQFGNIAWSDEDLIHKLITEDIPGRVAADPDYQNAMKHNDRQNARVAHDAAQKGVMTAVLKDDTELFKQFMDNESFRRWITDTVFSLANEQPNGG